MENDFTITKEVIEECLEECFGEPGSQNTKKQNAGSANKK